MRLIALVLLTWLSATAQTMSEFKEPVETDEVSCESHTRIATTLSVKSVAGVSAAVEVAAKLRPANSKADERCYTTWTLHIRPVGEAAKHIVVDNNDDENSYEYGAEIDSWSRDGRLLLFSTVIMGGDWDATQPFVYDLSSRKLFRVELERAFNNLHGRDCAIYFRPIAFVTRNEIAVSSGAVEQDLAPGQKPCFPDTVWAVNFRTLAARRITSKQVTPRIGIVRKHAE